MPKISRRNILVATAAGTAATKAGQPAPALDKDNLVTTSACVSTISEFIEYKFGKTISAVTILGYRKVGLGTLSVRRVDSQPSHHWKFRSRDRFLANGTVDKTDGGWWEGYSPNNIVTPEMFGAYADVTNDDHPAITAALNYARAMNQEFPWSFNKTGIVEVHFPSQRYLSSSTIIVPDGSILRGRYAGIPGCPAWTTIQFGAECTGFDVGTLSSRTVMIEGIKLVGVNGDGNFYGILANVSLILNGVGVEQFSLDGIYMNGTGGGNVDNSRLSNIYIGKTGRHGIRLSGADANVCVISNLSCKEIGGSAIWNDAAFFSYFCGINIQGSGFKRHQTRKNCWGAMAKGSDGNYYMVRVGQEDGAARTDPVADTKRAIWALLPKTLWDPFGYQFPLWEPNHTWIGAPVVFDTAHSTLINLYVEGGYSPPGCWAGPIIGGHNADQQGYAVSNMTASINKDQYGAYVTDYGWKVQNPMNGSLACIGNYYAASDTDDLWYGNNAKLGPIRFSWVGGEYGSLWLHGGSGFPRAMGITSNATALRFGRSTRIPFFPYFMQGLALNYSDQGGRVLTQSITAPSTSGHAVGEFCFNSSPSIKNEKILIGWSCTSRGSPDTWTPCYVTTS